MKCISLLILMIFSCVIFETEALRCASPDGLQVEDVRKVIKKCMKRVTVDYESTDGQVDDDDDENDDEKNYGEYESESNDDYEIRNKDSKMNERRGRDHKNIGDSRRNNDRMNNYSKNYNPTRLNHNYDYPQTGGNYYGMSQRNDRHDESQYSPYQSTYSGNNNFNQQGNFYGSQNKNNDNSTADKQERDRSCILQCFFQEFKMARKNTV